MDSLFPLRAGAHTLVAFIRYSASLRVQNAQPRRGGHLAAAGDLWEAHTVTCGEGKFCRKFWRLTVHAGGVYGLMTVRTLEARLSAVLNEMYESSQQADFILQSIKRGFIKFSRVDLARDFLYDGYILPSREELKFYSQTGRRLNEFTPEDYETSRYAEKSLYIASKKQTFIEFRYDKRKKCLAQGYSRRYTRQACSRIERRYNGARACEKYEVRTFGQLMATLLRLDEGIKNGRRAARAAKREYLRQAALEREAARRERLRRRGSRRRVGAIIKEPPSPFLPPVPSATSDTSTPHPCASAGTDLRGVARSPPARFSYIKAVHSAHLPLVVCCWLISFPPPFWFLARRASARDAVNKISSEPRAESLLPSPPSGYAGAHPRPQGGG